MSISRIYRYLTRFATNSITRPGLNKCQLQVEGCEERLPPGQLLSFFADPLAAVFGTAQAKCPESTEGGNSVADEVGYPQLDSLLSAADMAWKMALVSPKLQAAWQASINLPDNHIGKNPISVVAPGAPLLEAANAVDASLLTAWGNPLDWSAPWLAGNQEGGKPNSKHADGPGTQSTVTSVQVNVDAKGKNIWGDAANEPSLAIDPTDPRRMVIGWRQFDTVQSNFRQAGWAYSHDSGKSWTFAGVLEPGVFRSDPVLDVDAQGNFYYNSLRNDFTTDVFKSTDGGVSWDTGTFAYGGDKQWMTIDRTNGPGRGNVYAAWNRQFTAYNGDFTRSTNGGETFTQPINLPGNPIWGTLSVGPQSELYVGGRSGGNFVTVRSTNAYDPKVTPTFALSQVNLGGAPVTFGAPNPGGLLGQAWVATDHSRGPTRGNVYLLSPVDPPGPDPLDIMIARSTDGGATFSPPVRVNDDPAAAGAWQWFAAMSVAPNGRIDAVWVDTRESQKPNLGQLYHSYSVDGGQKWSPNQALTPIFDSHVGWPQQQKIGDYYHAVSDNKSLSIAYAATFNHEQDVYFLRVYIPQDVPLIVPFE